MFDRKNKKVQTIEVSLGLVVGYILVETAFVIFKNKPWKEAYGNNLIIVGLAGVIVSIVLFIWEKKKEDKTKEESNVD